MLTLLLPRELEYIASMDWGHQKPGCILWSACLYDGRMHVLHEWKYAGLVDEEIAAGYAEHTAQFGLEVRYIAADPSIWIEDGRDAARGQSRAETLRTCGMAGLRKAANDRVAGWSRLHSWLRVPRDAEGNPTGSPLLTIDESCRYLRRTIPAQLSDKTNAEDVDTSGDDHGVDALRYLVMSRPMATVIRQVEQRYNPLLEQMLAASHERPVLGAESVRRRVG